MLYSINLLRTPTEAVTSTTCRYMNLDTMKSPVKGSPPIRVTRLISPPPLDTSRRGEAVSLPVGVMDMTLGGKAGSIRPPRSPLSDLPSGMPAESSPPYYHVPHTTIKQWKYVSCDANLGQKEIRSQGCIRDELGSPSTANYLLSFISCFRRSRYLSGHQISVHIHVHIHVHVFAPHDTTIITKIQSRITATRAPGCTRKGFTGIDAVL